MKQLIYPIALSLLLGAGSCVTPKYKRAAELPIAETYYEQVAADSSSMAQLSWQEYFEDPQLIALLQKASQQNLDLLTAESRIKQAEAYYKQSLAAFFPSLAVGLQGSIERPMPSQRAALGTPYYDAQVAFSSSWEIDIFGKLRSARKKQRALLLQSKAVRGAAQTQLVAQVANLYYELIATDAQLQVCRTTIETREESMATLKLQMASAQANLLGVSQAAAQLYYAQSLEPQLQAQIHTIETTICLILGEIPHTIERGNDLTLAVQQPTTEVGYPMQLLAQRPDVLQAEQALIAAHQELNIARAQLYPSLKIQASVGSDLMDWINLPTSIFSSLIGGLTQPLFAQGQLLAMKRNATESRQQAEYDFLYTLLNAQKEVSDQLVLCDKMTQQTFYLQKQLVALHTAAHSAMELMKNGYANYLDLLYAQEALLGAEQQVIASKLASAQARINLYRALGGGWDPTTIIVKEKK